MYKTLMLLKEVNIYNHYNIELLSEDRNNQFDWKWVEDLHKNQLLNEDNFRLLITQDFPTVLSDGLIHLHRAGILTPENKAQLIAHSTPIAFVNGLKCLFHPELLTSSNFSFIAAAKRPHACADALVSLNEKGISVSKYARWLINEDDPIVLGYIMVDLDATNLLTDDNLALVAPRAKDLRLPLRYIQDILTQSNLETLCSSSVSFDRLGWVFCALRNAQILTQANFDTLMLPQHVALFTVAAYTNVWSRIPQDLLTQTHFQSLVDASLNPNPLEAMQRVRDQIIDPAQNNRAGLVNFNLRQSTHTASVHRSVSESASRLMSSYGKDLALEATIQKLKAEVNALDNTPIHRAAKRCVARITGELMSNVVYNIRRHPYLIAQ